MAASGKKRKREFQDENVVVGDNFEYLRNLGDAKKRRITEDSKAPVKKLFQDSSLTRSVTRELRSSKRFKQLRSTSSISPEVNNHATSSAATSSHTPSFQRRNSMVRIKKPLTSLKGSIKTKLAEQVRRSSMRGQQDYSLPIAATTSTLDHLRFMSVLQKQMDNGLVPEPDQQLQQRIDHEIRMRDGTAKLLAASKHPQQMLEAAKNLLTSNSRMLCYMGELQRRKTDEVLKQQHPEDGNQVPCKAKISVSDIRVPLMWRDADHFRSKGDHRRYAVFCLIRVGTEIYDTELLRGIDRTMTDVSFEDTIIFNDVAPDFECSFEVFCHRCQDDLSVVSTPKRIRKKIEDFGNSVGRSVGRRLSGLKDDSDPMSSMLIGPKFECIAKGRLRLSDVSECIGTFSLDLEAETNGVDLPLFGNFCCRLAAQPHCLVQDTVSGPLFIQDAGSLKWDSYWCCLKNLLLTCWRRKEDAKSCHPYLTIPVTKTTQVSEVAATLCQKSHCIQITSQTSHGKMSFNIAARDKADKSRWWDGIYQHLLDQVMWLQACESMMTIKAATPRRHSVYRKRGTSSLYDDTPVEDAASPMTRMLNRLNIPEQREEEETTQIIDAEVTASLSDKDKSSGVSPTETQDQAMETPKDDKDPLTTGLVNKDSVTSVTEKEKDSLTMDVCVEETSTKTNASQDSLTTNVCVEGTSLVDSVSQDSSTINKDSLPINQKEASTAIADSDNSKQNIEKTDSVQISQSTVEDITENCSATVEISKSNNMTIGAETSTNLQAENPETTQAESVETIPAHKQDQSMATDDDDINLDMDDSKNSPSRSSSKLNSSYAAAMESSENHECSISESFDKTEQISTLICDDTNDSSEKTKSTAEDKKDLEVNSGSTEEKDTDNIACENGGITNPETTSTEASDQNLATRFDISADMDSSYMQAMRNSENFDQMDDSSMEITDTGQKINPENAISDDPRPDQEINPMSTENHSDQVQLEIINKLDNEGLKDEESMLKDPPDKQVEPGLMEASTAAKPTEPAEDSSGPVSAELTKAAEESSEPVSIDPTEPVDSSEPVSAEPTKAAEASEPVSAEPTDAAGESSELVSAESKENKCEELQVEEASSIDQMEVDSSAEATLHSEPGQGQHHSDQTPVQTNISDKADPESPPTQGNEQTQTDVHENTPVDSDQSEVLPVNSDQSQAIPPEPNQPQALPAESNQSQAVKNETEDESSSNKNGPDEVTDCPDNVKSTIVNQSGTNVTEHKGNIVQGTERNSQEESLSAESVEISQSQILPVESDQLKVLPVDCDQSQAIPSETNQSQTLPAVADQSQSNPTEPNQSPDLPVESNQSQALSKEPDQSQALDSGQPECSSANISQSEESPPEPGLTPCEGVDEESTEIKKEETEQSSVGISDTDPENVAPSEGNKPELKRSSSQETSV